MKKVIDGAMYNTETARKLGGWSNTYNYRDFNYCEETLYRTKSGKFFIHGEGGAMSKYAQTISSNEWSGGEKIIPCTFDDARKWAEKHLSGDEYADIFGDPEDDSVEMCYFRLPSALKAQLDREVSRTGKTLSDVAAEAIAAYFAK